jgi:hypothetical protein
MGRVYTCCTHCCGHFQTLASVFSLARYSRLPLFPHHHKKAVSEGRNMFREKKLQIKPTCNLKMFLSNTELEEVGFAVCTKSVVECYWR